MSKKKQPQQSKPTTGSSSASSVSTPTNSSTLSAPSKSATKLSFHTLSYGLLAIICFIVYSNTLQHGFVLDDVIMVRDNTIVAKGFGGIWELLTTPHMRGYLIIPNDTYRPLSLVMFAMEKAIFGANPAPHHLFNIIVFALCCIYFFKFLDSFFEFKKPVAALIGALLFAIHPVHTEVVANIKSRDELLCFLFAFMALNVMLKYMREGKMSQLLASGALIFLSIISKENVIMFIFVVPYLFFIFKNTDTKRAIGVTISTVAASVAFIVIRAMVLSAYDANSSTAIEFIDNALVKSPDFITRFATSVVISGKYLWLLFIPNPLICNYSYNAIPYASLGDMRFIASFLAYAGIIYIAIKGLMAKNKSPWAFAIGFYLITIALFNNMFILIGAEMGERFLFMSSAGICMAAAFAADKWLLQDAPVDIKTLLAPKVLVPVAAVLVVFGYLTFDRNKDWVDNMTLYQQDLPKSPNDCRLSYYLGTAMAEELYVKETDEAKRKEIDLEALSYVKKAVAMYPDFTEANAETGRIYDRLRQYDSAEKYDKIALKLNPMHSVAMNNLGSVYLATAQYDLAINTFKKAAQINPNFELAYFNMARSFGQLKKYDSSIKYFNKVFEFDPLYPDAHQEIGMAFYMLGNFDSAAVHFKHVIDVRPQDANAINNLGAVYLNNKKYADAIKYFQQSIQLNPNYVNAYSNIGRAYYFNNQFKEAIEAFNKELSLDNKAYQNIPYIALSFQGLGNMEEARKYEAVAKRFYSDFKLK